MVSSKWGFRSLHSDERRKMCVSSCKRLCGYTQKTEVTGKEHYNIDSCSKLITCTAALQRYENGMFGHDDALCSYMSDFENMTVADGDSVRPAKK